MSPVCTFTSTKRGTIIVEKQTVPTTRAAVSHSRCDAAGPFDNGQIVVTD